MNDYFERQTFLAKRIFGYEGTGGSRASFNTPGHYIDARDRLCLKCHHTLCELLDAKHYIPCNDEIPEAEEILPPKTLVERAVESLEGINTTLKHKKFDTDLKPLMEKIDDQTRTLYGALKRRR